MLLLLGVAVARSQEDRILDYSGVFYSVSCKGGPCWNVIERIEVQRALLAAAKAPIGADELKGLLGKSGPSLTDLELLRMVRRQGDRYQIAFTLLPARDVRQVRAAAEASARRLADSLLSRRTEIEAALERYSVPGVDRKDVAFVVLGCFSLDWDGLNLTKSGGYRSEKGVARPDGRYIPWAEERLNEPYRSFSQSHSNVRGDAGAVYFSDGHAPDAFLMSAGQSRAAALRTMLLAMRDGTSNLAALGRAAGIAPSDAEPMLAELAKRRFVRISEMGHAVNFPVLSKQDGQMVATLRKIGRESITSWLASDYKRIESELAGIAPVRAGVPFTEVFNLVWHHVFGRANAMLIEAGLFADPYAEGRYWPRYTPAVYWRDLTK